MNKEVKYDIRVLRCNMCGRVWERDDDDPFAPQCCPNCSASIQQQNESYKNRKLA